MGDGSDNPFVDMGLLGMMQPNPYINPAYAGKPLKLPGFYTGTAGSQPPTDAMGKPIQSFVDYNNKAQADYQAALAAQPAAASSSPSSGKTLDQMMASFTPLQQQWWAGAPANEKQMAMQAYGVGQATPGTTLNSTPPAAGQDNGLTALNDMRGNIVAQNATLQGMPSSLNQGGFGSGNNVLSNTASAQTRDNAIALDQLNRQIASAGQPAAAGGSSAPAPPDLRQAYLDALASPGKVTTPGATVPQSPPLGVPSVMDSFLAAHPSGGAKGAGTYDNSGFFNTLNQLGRTA